MPPVAPADVMSGFSAILKIGGKEIGFATNVGWNEDFRLQPIEVVNVYGPLDHKTTGWQCTVTTGIYLLDSKLETEIQFTAKKSNVTTVGLVDIEILDNITNLTKDRFRNCRTASKNIAYAANALVSGGSTWMALDHES